MNKLQRQRALAPIRSAIHGWAFAPTEWLPKKIALAESEKVILPPELHEEAEQLIAPLREAIRG